MPVYEYYCNHCDGIFEAVRPMREASEAWPCPACEREGSRIMPTSFAAFTLREGYPRKLPDKGTYWHLGKEVKKRIKGPFRPFEHPELAEPRRPKRLPKGDRAALQEREQQRRSEMQKMRASGVRPTESRMPKKLRNTPKRGR
jgi:putative FmdB family regulatory protein